MSITDEDWRSWLCRHRQQFAPRFTVRNQAIGCITCGIARPLMQLGRVYLCQQCAGDLEPVSREHVRQALEPIDEAARSGGE